MNTMDKYLYDVFLSINGKILRTEENNLILGNFLSKYVDFAINTSEEALIKEAKRMVECILCLNPKIEVEITVRYKNTINNFWEGLYLVKEKTVIKL